MIVPSFFIEIVDRIVDRVKLKTSILSNEIRDWAVEIANRIVDKNNINMTKSVMKDLLLYPKYGIIDT